MGSKSKKEYLVKFRERYKKASKKDKSTLLDELCIICGYNRKYAIRVLNSKPLNILRLIIVALKSSMVMWTF